MLKEIVQQGEQSKQLVAIKFFAPWCQACKALYPKWMQLATQNPDVTFVKVGSLHYTQVHSYCHNANDCAAWITKINSTSVV